MSFDDFDIDAHDTILTCSSGYSFSGNCAIVGLSRHEPMTVYGGYDDVVFMENWRQGLLGEVGPSNADLVELADFMIGQWTAFKRHYGEKP